ncbi:MAG: trigger factor [Solirubrobacteraceae bacterium]|jgi:trigger factor|nr:trigger factor [Solirubrobacteraceae bacterium]
MATAVNTTVTELPESRVSVDVEIAADEIQRSLENQARKLGQEMKVPGFRTGKIPPAVVIQRLGRESILDEAVRGRLTDWYLKAVQESGIAPVGDPDVDLGDLPPEGKALKFSFEVGVRPTAKLGTYRGVEVGRREPAADPEAIDAQIEEMRERFARLEVVKRPAENGDFVTIDFVGTVDGEPFSGGEGRDQLIDLGAGQLIPGFEEGIVGASAGEERLVDATFPEDYGAKHVAGKAAQFQITVKEVKHKDLPALDDEFASDAAGFDSLEELRESIAEELLEHDRKQVEIEFRAGALDAVVAEAEVDVPEKLVEARANELLDRMLHALSHQGIDRQHYLQISGKTEAELMAESKPEAEQALRREAVLAAIIEAEKIEPGEQELLDALEPAAEREQMSRQKLLDRLRSAGRVDALAKEVAAEQAIEIVISEAKAVTPAQAERKRAAAEKKRAATEAKKPAASAKKKAPAKKKAAAKKPKEGDDLWTPGGETPAGDADKLWTPGS